MEEADALYRIACGDCRGCGAGVLNGRSPDHASGGDRDDFHQFCGVHRGSGRHPANSRELLYGRGRRDNRQCGTFDGLTYTFAAGPSGTLLGGIITNQFNSFIGLSLGGSQSGGQQFFFGGDSVTVTFPSPINAIGAFFNVNMNSGNYVLATSAGSVSTGSATYDTPLPLTFVFDGLISTTPFTSATFSSTNTSLGSFNIPEIQFGAAAPAVPEPSSLTLLCTALAAGSAMWWRRRFGG